MQLNIGAILLAIVALIIVIAVLWWIMSKLYQRSTTERAFVRTGFLGERVAISGGALVVPVLHEITWVNMSTMRISLSHQNADALITQDHLRINVDADFYVRVKAEPSSVAAAARSLGSKTSSVEAMRQLLEARFNDALRTAAAQYSIKAMHEDRSAYSTKVRALASAGIDSSGLEIDSVSISNLDQAGREFFNPNNASDAAGLTILTAEIEERRQRRNEIERDSQVAIQRKNLEAEQQMLELQKEEEYARLQQEREISIRRVQQQSDITVETEEMRRQSKLAEVNATEVVEKARMLSDRTLREQKLRMEQQLQEAEVDRTRAIGIAENEKRAALELALQQTEIAIAEHSQVRNAALAQAELSRAQAVRAEESVVSARELEKAEREKALFLVMAAKEVEAKGLAAVAQASTEREVASKRAETIKLLSEAESGAESVRQHNAKQQYEIDANGRRALNEAENIMSPEAMSLRARLAAIERIEGVVRESVKPLEHISDIKIMHVDGLSGLSKSGDAEGQTGGSSISDQVMQSALKYKLQAPLVDALLESAGLDMNDVSRVLKS